MISKKKPISSKLSTQISRHARNDHRHEDDNDRNRPLNVKSKKYCQSIFTKNPQVRQKFRHSTNIKGQIKSIKAAANDLKNYDNCLHCRIVNISSHGIGMSGCENPNFQANDVIMVRYMPKKNSSTIVEKKAVIRSISENYMACEFINNDVED